MVNCARHFKVKHLTSVEAYKKLTDCLVKYKVDYDALASLEDGIPIQGLPVFEGHMCVSCGKCSRSETFARTHSCEGGLISGVLVQQVMRSNGTYWFHKVDLAKAEMVMFEDFGVGGSLGPLYSGFQRAQQAAKEIGFQHDSHNTKSAFHSILKWDELCERLDLDFLGEMIVNSSHHYQVGVMVEKLFKRINSGDIDGLVASEIMFEDWLGANQDSRRRFVPIKSPESYIRTLESFVGFLCACFSLEQEAADRIHFPQLPLEVVQSWWKLTVKSIVLPSEEVSDDETLLMEALLRLLLWEMGDGSSTEAGIFPVWLVGYLAVRRPDGIYTADDITSVCSHLKFVFRGVVGLYLQAESELKPPLMKSLQVRQVNIYYWVAMIKSVAKDLLPTAYGVSRLVWVDPWIHGYTRIQIDGQEFGVEDWCHAFSYLKNLLGKQLEELLLGFKIPVDFQKIWDYRQSRGEDYAFGSDMNNDQIRAFHDALIKGLMASKDLQNRFIARMDDQKPVFKETEVKAYFKQAEAFLETLLVLSHISSGLPPRGSEHPTIALHASANYHRGVFWENGNVLLVMRYSKTRSLAQLDRVIGRYLDKESSQVLATYLISVVPFLVYLNYECRGPTQAASCHEFLYVRQAKALTGDQVARIFHRVFQRATNGINLGISAFRHCSIALFEKNVQPYLVLQDHSIHEQAGHSAKTNFIHYARSNEDLAGISRDKLAIFREGSLKLHMFLNGEWPPTQAVSPWHLKSDLSGSSSFASSQPTLVLVPDSQPLHSKDTALVALKNCLKDPDATFRSEEQLQATLELANCSTDLLIILPTGLGKTLTWVCASKMKSLTTIVVVPYKTLLVDLKRRVLEYGVKTVVWDHDKVLDSPIILVQVEAAASKDFGDYLTHLACLKRIGLVVFEEAHSIVKDSSFRQLLGAACSNLSLVDAPIALVTATLPPSMKIPLLQAFNMDENTIKEVRASSDRPDLVYHFHVVEPIWVTSRLTQLVKSTKNKVAIYAHSKETVATLGDLFQMNSIEHTCWTGDLEADKKEKLMESWTRSRILISTSGGGQGLDAGDVELVVIFQQSHHILDIAQQFGRAARSLPRGNCHYLTTDESIRNSNLDVREFLLKIKNGNCIRHELTSYLDGSQYGISCIDVNVCSSCSKLTLKPSFDSRLSSASSFSQAKTSITLDASLTDGLRDEDFALESEFLDMGEQRSRQLVSSRLEKSRSDQEEMKQFKLDATKCYDFLRQNCPLCFFNGRNTEHCLDMCRDLKGRCLRCFKFGHSSKSCELSANRSYSNSCRICSFPLDIHPLNKQCNGFIDPMADRARALLYCCFWYKTELISQTRLDAPLTSMKDFDMWMQASRKGMNNGILLLIPLLKKMNVF